LKKELNAQIHFYLTCLLAFLIPIWPPVISPLIILLFINWLIGGNFVHIFRKDNYLFYFIIFISLYLVYLIGLSYSDHFDLGLNNLETKLSLLVLPVIFFATQKFDKEKLNAVLRAFLNGCIIASLICFVYASYCFITVKYAIAQGSGRWDYGINYFLKDRFSIWIHPSYRAMYFVLALVILFFRFRKEHNISSLKKYFYVTLLSIPVFLFSSKAGIISLFVLGIFVSCQLIFKQRRIKPVLIGGTVAVTIFCCLYFFAPEFTVKVKGAINTLTEQTEGKNSSETTASRIVIWNAATQVASQNWLTGSGTGDANEMLFKEYEKQQMTYALFENLNAHNQFLQTFIETGIAGILLLVSALIFTAVHSIRKRKYIYFSFLLLIAFNFTAESMLEAQAGVVFYAFFNSLFMFSEEEKDHSRNEN